MSLISLFKCEDEWEEHHGNKFQLFFYNLK